MDMGTIRGLVGLVIMVAFVALWILVWNKKNKARWDAAARLPLEDEETTAPDRNPSGTQPTGRGETTP